MILTVTDKDGYGGDIKMTIGIDCEGTITGLEILEINETAGLGMKAKEESFRKQYGNNRSAAIRFRAGRFFCSGYWGIHGIPGRVFSGRRSTGYCSG